MNIININNIQFNSEYLNHTETEESVAETPPDVIPAPPMNEKIPTASKLHAEEKNNCSRIVDGIC